MNKTVVIIGDSPFLGEIEQHIHYVLEQYPSIGINNALRLYNVSTHIFQDMQFIPLTNSYPDVKTVSLYKYGDLIRKKNKELLDSYTYNFKMNSTQDILKDGKLAWCGFTHDYAISYCIIKGYKNIVLIGAADFIAGKHYATDEDFKYSEKLKQNSKRFIEEVCTQRANILTCNPNSTLEVPRISIDKFLETDFQNL